MATHKCGWCGSNTHMTDQGRSSGGRRHEGFFADNVLKCDECTGLSVLRIVWSKTNVTVGTGQAFGDPDSTITSILQPTFVEGQDFPDVPEHIATAASEAHKSASIGNRMSAILMARTVIEATAKDKGILKGTLQAKIEAMQDKGLVRPHVKESADEIRHFGNDMAHGDITEPVDDDDVTEVLALMDEVLNEVYQSHARLAKVREKRLAKKAAGAS